MTKRKNTATRANAYAAGRDAGNRSMAAAGRTEWSDDDFNAASEAFAKVAATIE